MSAMVVICYGQARNDGTVRLLACERYYAILNTVGKYERLYQHILARRSDANVPFTELCQLLKQLGFRERIKGDHHIFTKGGIRRNSQPSTQGRESKALSGQAGQKRNT